MYQTRTSNVDANGITVFTVNTFTIDDVFPCQPDENSASVLKIPLFYSGAWVGLLADNPDPSLLVENTLTIDNLLNPAIFGTYTISLVVYTNLQANAHETFSQPITITAPPFTTNFNIFSTLQNDLTLIEFKFNAPVAFAKSNRNLGNFFDEFSKFQFDFHMRDLATFMFTYDAGYTSTTTTSKFVTCWASDDLNVYVGGLKCELIYGPSFGIPTTSNFVSVIVTNYKSLALNDRVSVTLMVKHSQTSAIPVKVSAKLINVIGNEDFIIGTNVMLLGPTTAASATPLAGLASAVVGSLGIQASQEITFSFSTATAAIANDMPAFSVLIPAGWDFSTNIFAPTQVFLDGAELFTGKFYFNTYLKALYITPKDDLPLGAHTIRLKNIFSPAGERLVNTFSFKYFTIQTHRELGSVNVGSCLCSPIATVVVSSDIPKYSALGASYTFTWTSAKHYTLPQIVITMPVGPPQYLFSAIIGFHKCRLFINSVGKFSLLQNRGKTSAPTANCAPSPPPPVSSRWTSPRTSPQELSSQWFSDT
jgi:hypothetical protein